MSNDEMKKFADLVKAVVKEEIKPLAIKLDENTEELKSVSDQVAVLTVKVDVEIIPVLETHTKVLQDHTRLLKEIVVQNQKDSDNIQRLDKRLSFTEAELGIHPPIEHQLVK